MSKQVDVVIVGAGSMALCGALAAQQQGADVLLLERASQMERRGNSAYTAGAFRVAYEGTADLVKLVPDLTDEELAQNDYGAYTEAEFFEDMGRITQYRTDPDLAHTLVSQSLDTLLWMRDHGVRFMPMYQRQAFKNRRGGFRFWGGLTVEANGGAPGWSGALVDAVEKGGAEIWYDSRAVEPRLRAPGGRHRGGRAPHRRRRHRPGEGGRPGERRLRGNAEWRAPRPGMGPGEGPGHSPQHRRRHPDGARDRRRALRPLERFPRSGGT